MSISISDIPVLQRNNVKMKNPDDVLSKINHMITRKKENLQVITDYDFTLTKQHVNGTETLSSFGLLALWDQLPSGFMSRDMEIKSKYYPYEVDLHMTPEEKTPHMIEWYRASESLWKGVTLDMDALYQLIAEKGPELRDGTVELFKKLEKNKIPVLVLSAGLGNVLKAVLTHHGLVENDYFHIISNFFKFKNGVVDGYGCGESGSFIHPFNKNGLGCLNYFKNIGCNKPNVILMGDSLGDARMDQGVPNLETVLKIGFLYGTPKVIEQSLPKYLECFDIVLVDDQTMDVLAAIIGMMAT